MVTVATDVMGVSVVMVMECTVNSSFKFNYLFYV